MKAQAAPIAFGSILAYREDDKKAVLAVDDGKLPESLTKIVALIREVVAPTI